VKHIVARDQLEAASDLAAAGEVQEALEKVEEAKETLEELSTEAER